MEQLAGTPETLPSALFPFFYAFANALFATHAAPGKPTTTGKDSLKILLPAPAFRHRIHADDSLPVCYLKSVRRCRESAAAAFPDIPPQPQRSPPLPACGNDQRAHSNKRDRIGSVMKSTHSKKYFQLSHILRTLLNLSHEKQPLACAVPVTTIRATAGTQWVTAALVFADLKDRDRKCGNL